MKNLISYPTGALSDEEWVEKYNADRVEKFNKENTDDSFLAKVWCGVAVVLTGFFWLYAFPYVFGVN
jgi:hypothetical protein